MSKKSKKHLRELESPEMEEIFNTIAVDEVYPKTTDLMQFLKLAVDKGYISEKVYNKHQDNLLDIIMVFQPRSKYGKAKKNEVS